MMDFQYPKGATPLGPDEAEGLLLTHITTREELNRWEQENIAQAVEWAYGRKHSTLLSQKFVLLLHKKMFENVWSWAGEFRKSMKNLGIAPWLIATEVNSLCADTFAWIEYSTYSVEEIAVRFHHRLVCIHPFANGNGRHARLMTDLLLVQKLDSEPFTWGRSDLVLPGEIREQYIAALRAADKHDLSLLLKFVRT